MKNHDELTAADLYNLKFAEIDEIQTSIDAQNMATIESAFKQGRINDEEYDYMMAFFRDGMGVYREVYRSLYETFGSPIYTADFQPQTGEVKRDQNGKAIDYSLKVVTPFVYTKLKFSDKNNNAIHVIFPKMKSAERAIEKIDKEFGREYNKLYQAATDVFFLDEDRDAYIERIQSLPKSTSQLHDILRLTITCKYLHDVKRIKRKFSENTNKFYHINPEETRDRFDKPLYKNKNRYYDIKMIMHQKTNNGQTFDVEVQLKINTLFRGDIRTHGIYERMRKIEAMQSPSDPAPLRESQNQSIKLLDNLRTRIDINAVHQYNMMVIDKIFRIEDNDYRPLRVVPDNADGTYEKCCNFITDGYLVESYQKFDPTTAFSADDEVNKMAFLKLIGALPKGFDEFSENASAEINNKFNKLDHAGRRQFQKINDVATRYQHIIQQQIDNQIINDLAEAYTDFAFKDTFDPQSTESKMCYLTLVGQLPPFFSKTSKEADEQIQQQFQAIFTDTSSQQHQQARAELENIIDVAKKNQRIIRQQINRRRYNQNQTANSSPIIPKTR
ncbi:MAG: hypothetical protein E7020_01020 [Alphaproteobacteria bacterium]|nr:hypothetical protein [Alphaproteobacteria bacterium]